MQSLYKGFSMINILLWHPGETGNISDITFTCKAMIKMPFRISWIRVISRILFVCNFHLHKHARQSFLSYTKWSLNQEQKLICSGINVSKNN